MAEQSKLSTYYFKQAIKEFGAEYVKELVKQLLLADKKATGELIHSINYKLVEASNEILLEILAAPYLKYVDKGRKAGGKMPPVQPIIKWAKVRNIKPMKGKYKKIDEVGWAIARGIQKNGIKPTNVLEKAKKNIFSNKALIDKLSRGGLLDLNEMINKTFGNLNETTASK